MNTVKHISLVLLMGMISFITQAQPKTEIVPRNYIAYRTTQTITIDGKDSEASWSKINWSQDFIDIEGTKKPEYQTNFKMLWDDDYFYVLAKIQEPHIWATLKQKDTIIFYNNDFEIFIDPDGDTHNYYELELNALNTTWDLFITKPYREGNATINDWTITDLKSAISIDGTLNNPNDIDSAWTVEMAIPWKVFKSSYFEKNVPKDDYWRINFSRVNWNYQLENNRYQRKKDSYGEYLLEYNWVWSPTGVINMHEPEKWGYIYFSSKSIGKTDTFIIPTDEKIKWELYRIHRAQKAYFDKHKKFATHIKQLIKLPVIIDGKKIEPKLEIHSTGYNLSVRSPFSGNYLTVKEDGKFTVK